MAQQNPDVRSVSQVHPDKIRPLFDGLQAVDDLNNINTGNPPRNHNLPDGWSSPPQARVLFDLSFVPNTRHFPGRRLFSGDGYQLHEQSLMAIVNATADVAMAGYSDLVSSREVAVALILSTAVFSNRMPFGELNYKNDNDGLHDIYFTYVSVPLVSLLRYRWSAFMAFKLYHTTILHCSCSAN